MTKHLISASTFAVAALLAGMAQAAPPVKAVGGMLVDASGMTLYTFDKDMAGSGKSMRTAIVRPIPSMAKNMMLLERA